jgi:hypothetical protein
MQAGKAMRQSSLKLVSLGRVRKEQGQTHSFHKSLFFFGSPLERRVKSMTALVPFNWFVELLGLFCFPDMLTYGLGGLEFGIRARCRVRISRIDGDEAVVLSAQLPPWLSPHGLWIAAPKPSLVDIMNVGGNLFLGHCATECHDDALQISAATTAINPGDAPVFVPGPA